jgi:hypothetical protein
MSQLHLYQSPINSTTIFIMEEKCIKKENKNDRKQIRFLSWNLLTGEIKIVINWIPDLVTTLRLYNCMLCNDGSMFICSVADYSIRNYFYQHWCYIIDINQQEIIRIVVQDTWCLETPIFINDPLSNNVRIISYPNYLQSKGCKSNLIASSCGKNRIKGSKVNHKYTLNIYDDSNCNKSRTKVEVEVKINKNKIYSNGEMKYDFDAIN